jgi:hypothetical protein
MTTVKLCRLLVLMMLELDISTNTWFSAQSTVNCWRKGHDSELYRGKICRFQELTLDEQYEIAAQHPTSRPLLCISILRGGADRSFRQRVPRKRKLAPEENTMDQSMKLLEERKERWKELCDPSDVEDLSSEHGDSDQPDIYKPPLEIEEGDVRDKD